MIIATLSEADCNQRANQRVQLTGQDDAQDMIDLNISAQSHFGFEDGC